MVDLRRRPPKNGLEKAIWVSKIGFFLLGILSVGVSARLAVPPAAGVVASAVPRVWASLCSWLVRPYLFVVIHLIILVIWKLSDQKQHHREARPVEERPAEAAGAVKIKAFVPPPTVLLPPEPSPEAWREIPTSPKTTPVLVVDSLASDACTIEAKKTPAASSAFEIKTSIEIPAESGDALELEEVDIAAAAVAESMVENDSLDTTWKAIMEKSPRSGEKPVRQEPRATTESMVENDSMDATWKAIMEKSPRSGKKPVRKEPRAATESMVENDSMDATWKAIMEKSPRSGKKPRAATESMVENDSMDATWKAIMEKSPRSVQKPVRQEPRAATESMVENDSMDATWTAIMEKSPRSGEKQTRRELRPPPPPPVAVPIRGRLPSVTGREELNQRFDDFIKKGYDQFRLQRHESNQRRLQMVNTGSY